MDESISSLLEAFRAESIFSGTTQTSLERLIEAMIEEQATLRKSCEELSQENQELQTALQQLLGTDVALYVSVASMIISILAVTAFIFLKKCLKHELHVRDKSFEEKISELNKEIQRLNSAERELHVKNESFEEKISELNREIQRLNLLITDYATKIPPAQVKTDSVTSSSKNSPVVQPTPSLSFIDEFNALLSSREDSTFLEKRDAFLRKYKISAFSCSNSRELIQDSDIIPAFKEGSINDSNDYWAYENGDCYLVVPSPDVQSYTNAVDIGRAFGKVFESNFKFGGYFTSIKVKTPASFKKIGLRWILKSRGTLILEQ